jgi:hypothetical protein
MKNYFQLNGAKKNGYCHWAIGLVIGLLFYGPTPGSFCWQACLEKDH